jgi:hypothetical protein
MTTPELCGLAVEEVDQVEAERLAASLFRKSFGDALPSFPRHFVLQAPDAVTDALGYVHFTAFGNAYLGGGLCVDAVAFRRLDALLRAAIRHHGGLGEILMRRALGRLSGASAVFGFVGDRRSLDLNLRIGFEQADCQHIIVRWLRPLPEAERRALLEKVVSYGPF